MADDKDIKENDKQDVNDSDIIDPEIMPDELEEGASEADLSTSKGDNTFLRRLMDSNFIEYASYVIKDRAIPDVDDGLKPVQRRILWSLIKMDDGKFHKVANVIGHTMQFHPHGDASIGDALVVLANKEYYIEKQGNFGNILTGDSASAARYIECRLTPLAKEIMFNNDITEFVDSYDGRNKEPVCFPAKLPSLLMLGADGIAVGMATHILPHNFKELLEAQIAYLKGERFELYPDFLQGGIMDASEYNEGNGKIQLRAKIEIQGRKLIITEIPATKTTESLIASIEKAANKNKIKIASINDYTTENVEIEITPMRGYDPQKALNALYAYTDCSVSVSCNMMVICENRPVQMKVSDVLKRNTDKLVEYLRRELEIELGRLEDKFHDKTLEQIFIENRIYKRIEECETFAQVMSEVRTGLEEFIDMLKREITDEDIQRLLAIPIRRISLFDINKNKKDIDDILAQIEQVKKNLKRIKAFTIKHIENLLEKYGDRYPRRTEIETFDQIDRRQVALNNIKVGWDRKNCYIGTSVRSDETVTCNEYDHLLCLERTGKYKVINIVDKVFIGRLFYFARYDKDLEYAVIYTEKKTGKAYYKRCRIDKFITDREYQLCPKDCKLEVITSRLNSLYEVSFKTRVKAGQTAEIDLRDAPERSAKARGLLVSNKQVTGFKFLGLIDDAGEEENNDNNDPNQQPPAGDGGAGQQALPLADRDKEDTPAVKTEVKAEVKAEPAPKPAPAAQKEPKTEAKPEPAAKAEPKPVVHTDSAAKTESPPAAKVEPIMEALKPVEPEPEVKEEPKQAEPVAAEPIVEEMAPEKASDSPAAEADSGEDDLGMSQPEFGF